MDSLRTSHVSRSARLFRLLYFQGTRVVVCFVRIAPPLRLEFVHSMDDYRHIIWLWT